MARKDINIRVRAEDKASREAKRIADALKLIAQDGLKASEGASKFGSALGAMSGDMAKLEGRLAGLKAFDKLIADMNRAEAVAGRLDASLAGSGRGFAVLRQQADQAAQATAQYRQQLAEQERRQQTANADVKLAASLQRDNKRELEAAQRALKKYNDELYTRGRGANRVSVATVPTADQMTRGDALRGTLAAAESQKRQLENTVRSLRQTATESGRALTELAAKTNAAANEEKQLAADVQKAGNALLSMRLDAQKAQQKLDGLRTAAAGASANLGGVATRSEDVARAAQRSAAQLAQLQARVAQLDAPTPTVVARTDTGDNRLEQIRNLQELNKAYIASQAEVRRLASEMRGAAEPTVALGTAFGTAQTRVSQLKTALDQQRAAIRGASQEAQSGYAAWARAFNPIVGSSDRAAAAQKRVADQAVRTKLAALQIAPAVQRAGAAYRQKANDIDRSTSALQRSANASRNALSFYQRMRSEVIALTASYVGLNAALQQGREAVGAYRTLEAVQSRLGAVLQQDVAAVGQEMDWLRGQARRLGIDFGVLGDEYAKFAVAADAANFSMEDTREIFLSVAEAGRVNKLSMDQMSGIFLALQQMISKGKVTSEELRRQLGDRLPGAFNIFAEAIGVTTAELDEMMRSGEVLANRSTLLAFAREMTRRFGPQLGASLDTLTTDMGRFENSLFSMRVALAQGFVPALREALQAFNDFAASSEGAQTFATLGNIAGRLIQLFGLLTQNLDLLGYAAAAFVGVRLASYLTSMMNPLGLLARRFNTTKEAIDLIGPSMARIELQQTALGRAFSTTILRLDAYRARLTSTATATGRARGVTLALASTLGGLRTVMVATAGVARAMWAAIGGIPGLIATGIVIAVSQWATSTGTATSALVEHERQLNAVREAYQLAEGDVEDWADAVRSVTELDVRQNLIALENQFADATRGVREQARIIGGVLANLRQSAARDQQTGISLTNTDLLRDFEDLEQAVQDFLDLRTSTEEFKEILSNLATSSNNVVIRQFAEEIDNLVDSTDDSESSLGALAQQIAQQRSLLRLFTGEAEDADEAVLGLGNAVEETNTAFRDQAIQTYTNAIQELREAIPGVAAEMERLNDQMAINRTAMQGALAAVQSGGWNRLGEIAGLWVQATSAMNNANVEAAVGGNVIDRIIGIESAGNPNARNPMSSATGLGQFIESTWMEMFRRHFPEQSASMTREAILDLRTNPAISRQMTELYARENARALLAAGLPADDGAIYLSHFLGAGGARALLSADRETPVDQILSPQVIQANSSILEGRDAGDVIAWARQRMGISEQQLAIITEIGQREGEQAVATNERLAALDRELEQQRLINTGQERQAEIERAIFEARQENPNITEEELNRIREQTAALYDAQNARRGIEQIEERVNQLMSIRQELTSQMELARESGDETTYGRLRMELEQVNLRLQEAIPNAIAMWTAIGGPEAEAAIARLNTAQMSIRAVGQEMVWLNLNASQFQTIVGSFVDGFIGAFDNFFNAIAQGENAIDALKTAFLQFAADFLRQIAMMIIKQMILNMLAGFGGPIGIAARGLGGIAGHTGGMVGTSSIGSGNSIGMPAWVGAAYHTGGVAGLRPDEVSATLRVGEEILTEQDPRHRNNLGGEKSSDNGSKLTQILAIGEEQVREMINRYGKEAIVTNIKSEAPTIRSILGMR